jgi:2-phospho-L-lactate guanylyltransferase
VFAVLLPVKEFRSSKQRLASWLGPEGREALAREMFEDVWVMLRSSMVRDRMLVISSEPVVIERCRQERVPCLAETAPRSHSESVMQATQWAMARGVRSLLSIPIDTPAVSPQEIAALEELAPRYAVVVAPSADGTGTNALLRTPPDAIRPRFGPDSCARHVREAEAQGLTCLVHPIPSLAADIDTLEDAVRFLSLGIPCRTAAWLREWRSARQEHKSGVAVCS